MAHDRDKWQRLWIHIQVLVSCSLYVQKLHDLKDHQRQNYHKESSYFHEKSLQGTKHSAKLHFKTSNSGKLFAAQFNEWRVNKCVWVSVRSCVRLSELDQPTKLGCNFGVLVHKMFKFVGWKGLGIAYMPQQNGLSRATTVITIPWFSCPSRVTKPSHNSG